MITESDQSIAAHHAHTASAQHAGTPKTIEAEMDDATWQTAAHEEPQGIINLEVFELSDTNTIPPEPIHLHTFWLFPERKPDNTPKA